MAGVAVIGDVGGHAELLRRALEELDGVVIQVGDLVDRGPDSMEVLEVVASRLGPDWVQLIGNHEAQYLQGQEVFWPEPLPAEGVARLREWWRDGRMRVAAAVSSGGEEFLLTHAGVTLAVWQELGEPESAVKTAELLNERPEVIWRMGVHGRDPETGPLWAESGAALHEPWMRYGGIVPFGQIHGHSTVDWQARHVRVRVNGRMFVGVDPGHGRSGAQSWAPLRLDDAEVH
ncbi:metallophosphoesterase [Lentzea sp. JNUCC 0626]|uniref:metallophosphoesterase n=1 Tax=Lentzea sp. JNUCC 0626 TaxID=3367513 RepID=UPI003748AAF9